MRNMQMYEVPTTSEEPEHIYEGGIVDSRTLPQERDIHRENTKNLNKEHGKKRLFSVVGSLVLIAVICYLAYLAHRNMKKTDKLKKYITSDKFKELIENESKEEIRHVSEDIISDKFQKYITSDKFKELVRIVSKEEIRDVSDDIMSEIKSLKKETEKLKSLTRPAIDCSAIRKTDPYLTDGVYNIQPEYRQESFPVLCDMSTDGGGWTVFQQRLDGLVDFYQSWTEYKNGFGNLNGEFWLGNDKLHMLTSNGQYQMRIELGDWDNSTRHAAYSAFAIGNEASNYQLSCRIFRERRGEIRITYYFNQGDSLKYHNGKSFTTKDRDNDVWRGGNCAVRAKGAWWYVGCSDSNLNGEYLRGKHSKSDHERGINWYHWTGKYYSLKQTKMMIRRK